ncbi:MAG: hypothetical protein ACI8UO_004327 [Verrucomicrobiales bacterium]|jgi:hypothetical protein
MKSILLLIAICAQPCAFAVDEEALDHDVQTIELGEDFFKNLPSHSPCQLPFEIKNPAAAGN